MVAYSIAQGRNGEAIDALGEVCACMADLTYYAAKIEECLRLLEDSPDPLYRDVYQAMANEFAEKRAALSRRAAEQEAQSVPPSPLLYQTVPAFGEAHAGAAADNAPSPFPANPAPAPEPERRRRKRGVGLALRQA